MNLEMRPPRYADAVYIYDSILQNFKFAADTEAQNILAWSMVNKAYALHRSNPSDPSMALMVYYQLLSDYGKNPNPAIQETIALAAHNAGAMCAGHVPALSDKAIWFFDFVINNYQSSKNERVQFYIADSLFLKAVVFDQQVRDHREAKKLYAAFVKTCGNSKNVDLAEKINRAKVRLRELS